MRTASDLACHGARQANDDSDAPTVDAERRDRSYGECRGVSRVANAHDLWHGDSSSRAVQRWAFIDPPVATGHAHRVDRVRYVDSDVGAQG